MPSQTETKEGRNASTAEKLGIQLKRKDEMKTKVEYVIIPAVLISSIVPQFAFNSSRR